MKFLIVLLFTLPSVLMADVVGAPKIKNNPIFTVSASAIAAGKILRDLLWKRFDAMSQGWF